MINEYDKIRHFILEFQEHSTSDRSTKKKKTFSFKFENPSKRSMAFEEHDKFDKKIWFFLFNI